jgi:hypothetical protein
MEQFPKINSSETLKNPEKSPYEIAKSLDSVLAKYSHPRISKALKEIADKICDAVEAKDKEELLRQIELFGSTELTEEESENVLFRHGTVGIPEEGFADIPGYFKADRSRMA